MVQKIPHSLHQAPGPILPAGLRAAAVKRKEKRETGKSENSDGLF